MNDEPILRAATLRGERENAAAYATVNLPPPLPSEALAKYCTACRAPVGGDEYDECLKCGALVVLCSNCCIPCPDCGEWSDE